MLLVSAPTCERGSGVLLIKGLLVGDEKGDRTSNDGEGLSEIGTDAVVGTRTSLGDNAIGGVAEDGLATGVKSDVGLRDGGKEGTLVIVGFCSGDRGNIGLLGALDGEKIGKEIGLLGVLEGGKIGKDIGLRGVLEGGNIGKGVSLDDGVTLGEGTGGAREGEPNGQCVPDFADTLIVTFWPASQWVIAPSTDLLQEK